MKHKQLTCSNLPTKLQAMLLLFNKSENLECAQMVVSNLGEINYLFVEREINCKPLKLCRPIAEKYLTHSTKDKRIHPVGTCGKVPLVCIFHTVSGSKHKKIRKLKPLDSVYVCRVLRKVKSADN